MIVTFDGMDHNDANMFVSFVGHERGIGPVRFLATIPWGTGMVASKTIIKSAAIQACQDAGGGTPAVVVMLQGIEIL